MKLLRTPGLLIVFVVIIATQGHAGGGFIDASERATMCQGVMNQEAESATNDDCASPIVSASSQKFCPHKKPSLACTKLLDETVPVCAPDAMDGQRCTTNAITQTLSESLG